MVKIWGSVEELHLLPGDCDTEKYKCIRVYEQVGRSTSLLCD